MSKVIVKIIDGQLVCINEGLKRGNPSNDESFLPEPMKKVVQSELLVIDILKDLCDIIKMLY